MSSSDVTDDDAMRALAALEQVVELLQTENRYLRAQRDECRQSLTGRPAGEVSQAKPTV